MMFDVGVRLGYNTEGKAINRYYRIHDTLLSESVRRVQDTGQYVFSIIPLFRPKMKDVIAKHILLQDESAFNKEEQVVDEQYSTGG